MFEENDYITRQIKTMVKGLGKFMGLEQIKEILNLSGDEQSVMTDKELETIIVVSKIEIISANKGLTDKELAAELTLSEEETKKLLSNEIIGDEEKIDQLNQFVSKNQAYL